MGIERTLQGADVVGRAGNAAPTITVGWSLRRVLLLSGVLGRLTDVGDQIRSTHLQTAGADSVDSIFRVETDDAHGFSRGVDPGGASQKRCTDSLTGKRMCDDVQGSGLTLWAGAIQSRPLLLV